MNPIESKGIRAEGLAEITSKPGSDLTPPCLTLPEFLFLNGNDVQQLALISSLISSFGYTSATDGGLEQGVRGQNLSRSKGSGQGRHRATNPEVRPSRPDFDPGGVWLGAPPLVVSPRTDFVRNARPREQGVRNHV